MQVPARRGAVLCERTSPCTHAHHMARRLALLALLACAVMAARRPAHVLPRPLSEDVSESESFDPFILLEDSESYETTPRLRSLTTKISAKVIMRAKVPKVNVTIKNHKVKPKNKKDVLKSTTINIQSHTNFIMTRRPPVRKLYSVKRVPSQMVQYDEQYEQYEWDDESSMVQISKSPSSTRRPRPKTTQWPRSTPGPRTTTTTQRRRRSTTGGTTTTRRPPRTTQHITLRTTPRSTTQANRRLQTRKTTCSPAKSEWLSEYLQNSKPKKSPKKPRKTGFFTRIYKWISNSSWFGGSWFSDSKPYKPVTRTTTEAPPDPATASWFQNTVNSDDSDDGAYSQANTIKKPTKKAPKKNYNGYQLLRTYPDSQWKVHELLELQEDGQGSGLMWWTAPSLNGSTDLLVPPDLLVDVKDNLKSNQIDFDVVIWDIQKAIKYENPQLSKKQRIELEQLRGHPLTWRRYHRYADILRYLEYLQHSRADLVELLPLGRSSEGLPLVAVKISLPSNDSEAKDVSYKGQKKKWKLRSRMKPAVWVDAGAHAREWVAPAVATWLIHALVEGEKGQGAEYDVLRQAEFYVMPVINPDGYEHSHTHDRLWKKTRSRSADAADYFSDWLPWNWGRADCVGADADRNWDFHWAEHDASRDPCNDNYAGAHPFSEPETRAVSEFLAGHRGQIKVYLSLHAYSQAWLVASSHAHAPFTDDGELMEMGKLAASALADMYGTKYQVGTAADIRQPASGMSHDWAKARAGIKYAYHVDLRDAHGPYGFLLPGSQIISTARETWQALRAIVDNLNPE